MMPTPDRTASPNHANPGRRSQRRLTIRFEFADLDIACMQSLQAEFKAAFAENQFDRAVDAMDDDVVAALAVVGTPDDCIDRPKPYVAAGLKAAVLYHVLGCRRRWA